MIAQDPVNILLVDDQPAKLLSYEVILAELGENLVKVNSAREAPTAQLRETAERLRLASEAAGFGTYDYNATVGQVYWSPYLRRLAGIEGDEPLTLESALAVVHPEHRDLVRKHVDGYAPEE